MEELISVQYNSGIKNPQISDKTKNDLLNRANYLFEYFTEDINETGLSKILFSLPDILVQRETRKYLVYDYEIGKYKHKTTISKSSYFPKELKKEFIERLKDIALEQGYFLKSYYNPKNIQRSFQSSLQGSYNSINEKRRCHKIEIIIFTKEKFIENLKAELKEFIDLYNYSVDSLENDINPCFEDPEELLNCEISRILEYYEDLPELYDILEEFGIMPTKNKVFLRKI